MGVKLEGNHNLILRLAHHSLTKKYKKITINILFWGFNQLECKVTTYRLEGGLKSVACFLLQWGKFILYRVERVKGNWNNVLGEHY